MIQRALVNDYPSYSGDITIKDWKYGSDAARDYFISRGYVLPSYSDSQSVLASERNTNYVFECDLKSATEMDGYNYFGKADSSSYLRKYFSSKLCDKNGDAVTDATKLGVYIKDVNPESGAISNIESFTSSLKLAEPGNTIPLVSEGDYKGFPTKTIDFTIESDWGNVTVLASSKNDSGSYVGVYNSDHVLASAYNVSGNKVGYRPDYAMFLPGNDSVFPYFHVDAVTGLTQSYDYSTSSWADPGTGHVYAKIGESSNNRLFAHTFKLPKGTYFIASPSSEARIYYVAAQGQEKGNAGTDANTYDLINTIADVDFLSAALSDKASDVALTDFLTAKRFYVSFEGYFKSGANSITVTSLLDSDSGNYYCYVSVGSTANLTSLTIWNQRQKKMTTSFQSGSLFLTDTYIKYPTS